MISEDKQIVGHIICPDCGQETAIKVNKNGCLYIYCTNETNPDTGEKCGHRRTWGRVLSRKFIKENNLEVIKNGTININNISRIQSDTEGEFRSPGTVDTECWHN